MALETFIIMEDNKTIKILYLLGFLIFSAVSCWATTESLHLLLPSWPIFMCWGVTIGFFVIASIGSKLIVDSLNQNVYIENRGIMLIGGIFTVLIFWLLCSMPTNTHTFFYRTTIADVVTQDIATTKGYLQQLRDNVKTETEINTKIENLERDVNSKLTALFSEIDNLANPGFGQNAKSILLDIAKILQVAKIEELSYTSASPQQIKALKTQYNKMITEMLNSRKAEIRSNYYKPQEVLFKPEATKIIDNISTIETHIIEMDALGEIDNNIITQADVLLQQGYSLINNYPDFITFKSDADKELYTSENLVTKTTKMLSVIDVWKDYLMGKYEGRGFIFWIVISLLVDVAAFIFFDLAFKKNDY